MVQVTYVAFDGKEQTVDVSLGESVMQGAVNNGIEGIEAVCGGNCYCGTCRVYVAPEWSHQAGAKNEFENSLLESIDDTDPAMRLACQIVVTEAHEGLVVRIPEFQK